MRHGRRCRSILTFHYELMTWNSGGFSSAWCNIGHVERYWHGYWPKVYKFTCSCKGRSFQTQLVKLMHKRPSMTSSLWLTCSNTPYFFVKYEQCWYLLHNFVTICGNVCKVDDFLCKNVHWSFLIVTVKIV